MKPLLVLSTAMLLAASLAPAFAADPEDLEMVQSLSLASLRGVCGVAISGDGRFLYTGAYLAGAVCTFKRDVATGQLTLADSLSGPDNRQSICVRISADQKYAVVAQNVANTVTIFKRDADTGLLTTAAKVSEGVDGASGLRQAIEAMLSPDSQYLYAGGVAGIGVFKFTGDKLEFVEFQQAEGEIMGVRGCAFSPDGRWFYATAHDSGTLGVFRKDDATGKLEKVQILKSGADGINALHGAFRVAASSDGKSVYVSAGRFHGDQAISAFAVQPDGTLKLLQEFVNGNDDFNEYEGGNEITVSPDGKLVFAVTSVSDRLFRFTRDPQTGKLTFITSQQADIFVQPGTAGVCVSPDGKFVYAADEAENAVEAFKLP